MLKKQAALALVLALALGVAAGCGGGARDGAGPDAPGTEQSGGTGAQGEGDRTDQTAQTGQESQAGQGSQTNQNQQAPTVEGTRYPVVAGESVAQYSVREKFLQQDLNAVAVGKTSSFEGELILKDGRLQPSTVRVDLRTLKSDKAQRDRRVQTQALETDQYPYAEFAIAGMEGDAALTEGQEVAFKLVGQMTIHGTQREVTWDATARLDGDALTLTATTTFNMKDFGVQPPNVLNIISVDEMVQLDVQVTARKG